MMRLRKSFQLSILFLVMILTSVAFGQNSSSKPETSKAKPNGFVDYAFGKINSSNRDYGREMEAYRANVLAGSVDDFYFWSNALSLSLLLAVTAMFLLHLKAARRKEYLVASLIAQLWNGRVSDKIEIETRTEKYNCLAEAHNQSVERKLKSEGRVKSAAAESPDLPAPVASDVKKPLQQGEVAIGKDSSVARTNQPAPGGQGRESDGTDAFSLRQENLLLKSQINALQNTDTNLRNRINVLTTMLDQERKQNQTLKGA